MSLKWKYVEKLNEKELEKIENHFNIKLPNDYKEKLNECNQGKPNLECFDIEGKKELVIDYMINLEDVIEISGNITSDKLIPIATDPFGNFIAYKISDFTIVFWDHETDKIQFIANSFSEFLNKLYYPQG